MKYFITGTHAYGPVTKDSDLDIVLRNDNVPDIINFLHAHGIKTYQTKSQALYCDGGFYFDLPNIKINIIVAENQEAFDEWKRKTERMKEFEPIENRQQRIDFFNEG